MRMRWHLGIFVLCSILIATSSSAFEFNGTITDLDGVALNDTIVNFTVYNASAGFSVLTYDANTTNESGSFSTTVTDAAGSDFFLYGLSITHENDTYGHVDYIGQSLPFMPADVFSQITGTQFFLRPAGTINITAINSTGDRIPFQYQIKDERLGYPIAEGFDGETYFTEVIFSLPSDRNYSIMIFPNESMPVSARWDNFSSNVSYTFGLSSYNATTKTVHKQFNATMGYSRVHGFVNLSGPGFSFGGFDNLTIIPYLLEPGDMVHSQFGALPSNLSSFFDGGTDFFNLTDGFYNISLPSTVEDSSIILYATARNSSTFIGGFANLSLAYSQGGSFELNFSNMYGLLGENATISQQTVQGPTRNVTTRMQSFNLLNQSNDSLSNVFVHSEIDIDYTSFSDAIIPFTWMIDIDQNGGGSAFSFPLLNATGFEEMNIYAGGGGEQDFAPRRLSMSAADIISNNNITLSSFDPGDIGGSIADGQISMALVSSNASCDIPGPASGCFVGSSDGNLSSFDPFSVIVGGGKLSFIMGTGNIKVHYVNVDMLASGPPDALFDSSASESNTTSEFETNARFGSQGPTIYDYVLVSMPYTAGEGGLNESEDINFSIPVFYDEDLNVIWNVTTNGSNASALAGNYSHYSDYQSDWQTLMTGVICHENGSTADAINETHPCYVDKSNNVIWARLPHFSFAEGSGSGSYIEVAASEDDDGGSSGGSGGGGGGTPSYWTNTFVADNEDLKDDGITISKMLGEKERMRISVDGETHYVGVVDLTSSSVTINVSSDPQQAEFEEGESHKFNVLDEGYYDLLVTVEEIDGSEANVSVQYIHEEIPADASGDGSEGNAEDETSEEIAESDGASANAGGLTSKAGFWIFIVIIILVIGALGFYLWKLMDKKKRMAGTK